MKSAMRMPALSADSAPPDTGWLSTPVTCMGWSSLFYTPATLRVEAPTAPLS
jgi:hypothetical protein